MPPLTIFSCGTGPLQPSPALLDKLAEAQSIYASSALLEACPSFNARLIPIGRNAREQAREALEEARHGNKVVVLASGDALFHGMGGTLQSLACDGDRLEFIPAPTAFQALFHRLGMPWDRARCFSAHSTEYIPWGEILAQPLAVIYGGHPFTACRLAAAAMEFHPAAAERSAVAAQCLGTPDERIMQGPLAELAREECAPTSMLLLLPDKRPGAAPVLPLGLPADFYEKENNLITAEEVRAVILSKLRLPAWGVLWDVGAGSGSIGLEAAALRPGLSVYGLERQAGRLELMRRNCRRLGCVNYTCMQGEAPEALDALPKPDRVFTGGGGAALESIMQACFKALNPGGLLVASAVTTESEHLLYGWNAAARTGMFSLDIASESPIAGTYHHLLHGNRITLFTYSRT
ncbi:MAG: precorrin-6Y C5,15-methyltransferase (decarboxylating) subunit CbiT [Akkermansia sp.]|uniref:precorrin-6Y C5,15-methyltransferase (decarboxylating) subunit CbiT n=1 Tax=Akkermansia sp. TaxID=1872421 RepID=UPI0025C03F00|nr:precorrin-6Y C5,15-methyltransferase (decarboxylating) subunit CbiT [Akkermansia sp.]MBS5508782.1 precorrin-6Y C5,15-methyltransferase (decarboxylating) subunit CbiT [Akkermansia sp.]